MATKPEKSDVTSGEVLPSIDERGNLVAPRQPATAPRPAPPTPAATAARASSPRVALPLPPLPSAPEPSSLPADPPSLDLRSEPAELAPLRYLGPGLWQRAQELIPDIHVAEWWRSRSGPARRNIIIGAVAGSVGLLLIGSWVSAALERRRQAEKVAEAKAELDQRLDRIIEAAPEPPVAPETPSREELNAAYPYGAKGARSIEGVQAPPAAEVRFEMVGRMGCGPDVPGICLKYNYGDGAGFAGWMLVHKDPATGRWVRALDLGMPFPLRPPVTSPVRHATGKAVHEGKPKKRR